MSKKPKTDSPRTLAAKILSRWFREKAFAEKSIQRLEKGTPFVMEVVYGVLRRQGTLHWIECGLSPEKPDPLLQGILYAGLYELLFMDSEPDHAVIHDTVEGAKALVGHRRAGYVNALLRTAQRERRDILSGLKSQPLWIQHSHPDILFFRWKNQMSQHSVLKLMEWNNSAASVSITLNLQRTKMADFLRAMKDAELEAEPHLFNRLRSVTLPRGVPVWKIPGFEEGHFFVQDPAATMAPELLAPKPGEAVLDACAAPGGKTMVLGDLMKGEGTLIAMDRQEDRLPRMEENNQRVLGGFAQVMEGDASKVDALKIMFAEKGLAEGFDAVLADVPCSNTGVLRRRPEARWRFSERNLDELTRQQDAILNALARVVKPGGRLVYSTCSIEPEENEDRIKAFLKRHPDFTKIRERRILPQVKQTDGAFAALLQKSS